MALMYELPAMETVYLFVPRSRAIDATGETTSRSRLILREKGAAFLHKQARSVVASKRFVDFVPPGDPPSLLKERSIASK